jgi:hypothetical protein
VKRHYLNITGLCLILAVIILPLARRAYAAADWPAISQQELAIKDNPAEPGANAMILFHEESVNNKESQIDEYYREKIFTDAGKNLGNVEIEYIEGYHDIKNVQGRTIHPDGKVVEFDGTVLHKTLLKSGEISVDEKAFSLPDVTPGSIIEYRYRIQFPPEAILGAHWRVQDRVFTKQAHFTYVPYVPPDGYYLKVNLLWRRFGLPGNITPQKQKDGSWTLDVSDIAGVPEEDYMLPGDELRGRVDFFLDADDHPKESKEYWDKIAKDWADSDDKFIGKRSAIHDLVAQIVKPDDTPEAKLRKLYDRAQQIRNITYEESKTEQEVKRDKSKENNNVEDVLKHGYGYKEEINKFYVAMAQAAGFDASLVRVAPRDELRWHPELQARSELSTTLAWVHAADKDYYLDPGALYCPFDMLPWYQTAISGLRASKQGATVVQIPPVPATASAVERHAQLALDTQGSLSGTLTVRFTGQRALTRKQQGRNQDAEGRKKEMENEVKRGLYGNAKFTVTKISGWEKSDDPLVVEGRVTLPGIAESAGRRLLLPVGLYEVGQRQLFEPSSRVQDIYFPYPYQELDDITIQLPNNLQPATLPPPQTIDPGGKLKYQISAKQEGGSLQIQRQLVVGSMLYPARAYSALRQFFGMVKTDDGQTMVLQPPAASGNN